MPATPRNPRAGKKRTETGLGPRPRIPVNPDPDAMKAARALADQVVDQVLAEHDDPAERVAIVDLASRLLRERADGVYTDGAADARREGRLIAFRERIAELTDAGGPVSIQRRYER